MAPFKVAVMFEAVQLMDITCIDLLANCSTAHLKVSASFGPFWSSLVAHGIDMEILYLAETKDKPNEMTAELKALPTTTYYECPRDLDILLIGGPLLTHRPAAADKFLKESVGAGRVGTVMTTCVGSAWLASAGVINGRKATTNRGVLPEARKMYPDIEWVDQRWVVDGNLWTSGGAAAGNDMIATYILEKFHKDVAMTSCVLLDVDPSARGQFYKTDSGF